MMSQLFSFEVRPKISKFWLREKNCKTFHISGTKRAILGEVKNFHIFKVFFGEMRK